MFVKELVVNLKNKPGELHRVVSTLADKGVDIKAVTCIKVNDDDTMVKLIVIDPIKGGEVLAEVEIAHSINTVLVADIEDKIGELARVLELLKSREINIEYVYTTFTYLPGHVLVVIDVDDTEGALKVLRDNQITIVSDHTIKKTDSSGAFYEERNIQEYLSTVITP